jgi:hypothetical protein
MPEISLPSGVVTFLRTGGASYPCGPVEFLAYRANSYAFRITPFQRLKKMGPYFRKRIWIAEFYTPRAREPYLRPRHHGIVQLNPCPLFRHLGCRCRDFSERRPDDFVHLRNARRRCDAGTRLPGKQRQAEQHAEWAVPKTFHGSSVATNDPAFAYRTVRRRPTTTVDLR